MGRAAQPHRSGGDLATRDVVRFQGERTIDGRPGRVRVRPAADPHGTMG